MSLINMSFSRNRTWGNVTVLAHKRQGSRERALNYFRYFILRNGDLNALYVSQLSDRPLFLAMGNQGIFVEKGEDNGAYLESVYFLKGPNWLLSKATGFYFFCYLFAT
jgi:hypothetical protein